MKDDVKEIFATEIRDLIKRKNLEFTRYKETENDNTERIGITVKIVDTNIKITVDRKKTDTQRSEIDPDPRQFGDAQHVVDAAMQDWYPGKVNRWTDTEIIVTLAITGLPGLKNHKEAYELGTYYDDLHRTLDDIFRILHDKHWKAQHEKTTKKEQTEAKTIKEAFRNL